MDLIQIIHLLCYLLALIPSVYVSFSIDYTKFVKAKSNVIYYIFALVLSMSLTYLVGEFIFSVTTMFVK